MAEHLSLLELEPYRSADQIMDSDESNEETTRFILSNIFNQEDFIQRITEEAKDQVRELYGSSTMYFESYVNESGTLTIQGGKLETIVFRIDMIERIAKKRILRAMERKRFFDELIQNLSVSDRSQLEDYYILKKEPTNRSRFIAAERKLISRYNMKVQQIQMQGLGD